MDWLDLSVSQKKPQDPPVGYYFHDKQHEGISTLENMGNTCYLNTIVQCLAHTRPLMDLIYESKLDVQDPLLLSYIKLVKTMFSGYYKLTPTSFNNYFRLAFNKRSRDQEDAHEVLLFLLEYFHNLMKYPVIFKDLNKDELVQASLCKMKNELMSPINHLFLGQFHQRIRCEGCKRTSHSFPVFRDIELTFTDGNEYQTLLNLFDNLTKKETLTEYHCEKCNSKNMSATKITDIWRLPRILIISLARFRNQFMKNIKHIDYEINNLCLNKYVSYPEATKKLYNLYAIACHVGNLNMGHYYSIVRAKNDWIITNDADIEYVNKEDKLVTKDAYMLFYQLSN